MLLLRPILSLLVILPICLTASAQEFRSDGTGFAIKVAPDAPEIQLKLVADGHSPSGWTKTVVEKLEPQASRPDESELKIAFQEGEHLALKRQFSTKGQVLSGKESWQTDGGEIDGHIRFYILLSDRAFPGASLVMPDKTLLLSEHQAAEGAETIYNNDRVETFHIGGLNGKKLAFTYDQPGKVEVLAQSPDASGDHKTEIRIYWPPGPPAKLTGGTLDWSLEVAKE